MKKMRQLLWIMLIACLVLAGCGENTGEESTAAAISKAPPVSSTASMEEKTTIAAETDAVSDVWNPAVVHRQMLFDEDYVAGVLFLGYVDGAAGDLEHNRDYYQSVFEAQGYLEDFPFLAEIPNSNFVQTEYGQELYCMIPTDTMATVSVNEWITDPNDGFKGKTGDVLYRSETGAPILLKCNVSEIVSDVQIVIVDSEGKTMIWYPSLSGMDGSAVVESATGKLYDFTKYPENETTEILNALVGKVYDYHWSDEHETIMASVTAPLIMLDEESAAAYTELSQALTNSINERRTTLYNTYEERIPLAEEFYPMLEEYFTEFETKEEAMIRRADSNVFSVLYYGSAYEGGVHGYYYCFGENYDTKTGELLSLDDVVLDMEALPALVQEQLEQFWDPASFYDDLDLAQHFKENLEYIAWTLDYHGITFYFNPYEIAPYASGIQVVTVPFADHADMFAAEYANGVKSYGIQLSMETPFYYDIDGDGELNELLVNSMVSDDLIHVIHNIYIDGKCYEQTDFENSDVMPEDTYYISSYEMFNPHLIHLEDGRNYLFIENLEDSDMRTNTVYELTGGTVKMVETIYSGLHTEVTEESWYGLKQALTNPYNFKLDTRTWVVGTSDGTRTYYIGMDGYTYSYEDYYTFEPVHKFTLLKDAEWQLVDEYGIAGDSIVVKAGEEVIYYRTDASTFADFILPDGRIGRAELEWLEGICSIDGTDVEELFDGVVFAG